MTQLEAEAELAVRAARRGGAVLDAYFGSDLRVEHKGDVDLVTEADRAAEDAIVKLLQEETPDYAVLAEEGDYPARPGAPRWVVDPLDGTTNFAHGFPWFAVSIGLEVEGRLRLGVIFNPCNDEMYRAVSGGGAFLNDRPLRVSMTDRLDEALLATGFPYDRKSSPVNNYDHFVAMQNAARACRRPGAASLDLACVAAGRFDGFWEMKLKPWDVAAGALLVTEAGGRMSDFDGREFDLEGEECLASNGLIHADMVDVLQRGRRPAGKKG